MEVLGNDGSTTLNADEAIAGSFVLQAATCLPAFKVREFALIHPSPNSIYLHCKPTGDFVEAASEAVELTTCCTMEVYKHHAGFL